MTLERRALYRYRGSLGIPGLLSVLGLPSVRRSNPKPRERRGGFWMRNADRLEIVLRDIYTAYQRTMRRVHPDNGGSHEAAVMVNNAWSKIRRLFAKRGITL